MPGPSDFPFGFFPEPEEAAPGDAGAAGRSLDPYQRALGLAQELFHELAQFEDPARAYALVRANVDFLLLVRLGIERPPRGRRHPAEVREVYVSDPGPRSYVGFAAEEAAYDRLKPELLRTAEGKFVVLVGKKMKGPFETFSDALRAGYSAFGPGPLFVKQVLAEEPVDEVPHDVTPCRP
jgi:hypothetical protein